MATSRSRSKSQSNPGSARDRPKADRIVQLEVENFKRLSALTIRPDGATVIIGGKNGAGKSSAIDAIQAALGGKGASPKRPIKDDGQNATIVVQTERYTVTRSYKPGRSHLAVTSRDGAHYPNPQTLLDELVGPISFDPVAFVRLPAKEQGRVLSELVGLETASLDNERALLYDQRRDDGRRLKELQAALAQTPDVPDDTPDEPVSFAALVDEHDQGMAALKKNEQKRADHRALIEDANEAEARIVNLELQLRNAKTQLCELQIRIEQSAVVVEQLQDPPLAEIRERMAQVQSVNERVEQLRKRHDLLGRIATYEQRHRECDEAIKSIDARKQSAVDSASYPLPDLRVVDGEVLYRGFPLAQASSAEQLRVSTAIALAGDRSLRVALIRDGSLLDEDNLQAVSEVAAQYDAQVWIERVSTGDEVTVVIEDGAERAKKENR